MGLNKHNGQADICKPTEWPCFLYGGGGSRLIFFGGGGGDVFNSGE